MGPITDMAPGSVKGIHVVVEDMEATRAALTARGIELSDVDDMTSGPQRPAASKSTLRCVRKRPACTDSKINQVAPGIPPEGWTTPLGPAAKP